MVKHHTSRETKEIALKMSQQALFTLCLWAAGFLQARLLQVCAVWPSQALLLQQSRTSVPAPAQVQRQYLELHVEVSLCFG